MIVGVEESADLGGFDRCRLWWSDPCYDRPWCPCVDLSVTWVCVVMPRRPGSALIGAWSTRSHRSPVLPARPASCTISTQAVIPGRRIEENSPKCIS